MNKLLQKFSFFTIGVIIAVGGVFAARHIPHVNDILEKKGDASGEESIITHEEFNAIIRSLNGIENNNGVFKTTEGLILENRTTTPTNNEVGRIWFKK